MLLPKELARPAARAQREGEAATASGEKEVRCFTWDCLLRCDVAELRAAALLVDGAKKLAVMGAEIGARWSARGRGILRALFEQEREAARRWPERRVASVVAGFVLPV